MRRCLILSTAVCGFLAGASAHADDSLATAGTGGLVFEKADRISMLREDLLISPDEIRVRYEFRNDRGEPFTGHVAFPLPPVNLLDLDHRNSVFNRGQPVEWLDFHLTVNGIRVSPRPRIWATVNGRDVTQALKDNGIDVAKSGLLPNLGPLTKQPERLKRLEAIGAIVDAGQEPAWETNVAYEWDQTFSPGVTVIEHVYKPLLGWAYAPIGQDAGPPEQSEARAADLLSRFCVPRDTIHAAIESARRGTDPDALLWFSFASFVLKTARNWDGPIGTFHLTLRSSDPGTQAGACLAGMTPTKTAPAQWDAEATNWVASTDIEAVFLSDRKPEIPGEN